MNQSPNKPGARRLGGRYRLDERIAVGGMGEVWRGTDEVLSRSVAIKLLRPNLRLDDPLRQRFRTEARVAAMLRHEGIAALYDYGESDDSAFIVMELVDGEPLSTLISRNGTLGTDRTLGLMAQAARALQVAHERGVVHRDVKPANIMVTREGQVKITDFGIARRADHEPLTATGQVMGTAHYLAPEVAAGHTASPLSDVYALGIVTYECLAGWRPFDGDNQVAVATAQLRQQPPPLPDTVNPAVASLVMRVLSKDPARRPQSAVLLSAEFEKLRRRPRTASGSTPPGGSDGAGPDDARQGGGTSGAAAAAGAAGAAAVAGAAGAGAAGAGAAGAGPGGVSGADGPRTSRLDRRARSKFRGKPRKAPEGSAEDGAVATAPLGGAMVDVGMRRARGSGVAVPATTQADDAGPAEPEAPLDDAVEGDAVEGDTPGQHSSGTQSSDDGPEPAETDAVAVIAPAGLRHAQPGSPVAPPSPAAAAAPAPSASAAGVAAGASLAAGASHLSGAAAVPGSGTDARTQPVAVILATTPQAPRRSNLTTAIGTATAAGAAEGNLGTAAVDPAAPDPHPADHEDYSAGPWRATLIGLLGIASLVLIGVVAFDGAFGDPPPESRLLGPSPHVEAPYAADPTTSTTTTTAASTTTREAVGRTTTSRNSSAAATTRPTTTTTPTRTTSQTTTVPTTVSGTDLVTIAPGAHYAEQVRDAVRMLGEQGFTVSVNWVPGDGTQPENTVVDVQPTGSLPRGTAVVVSAVEPIENG